MTISSQMFHLTVLPDTDPVALAADLLFNTPFDPKQAAQSLAPYQDAVIRFCFNLLDVEEFQYLNAPAQGLGPVHAVQLLAEWQVQAALPRLLRIVHDDPGTADEIPLLSEATWIALENWGPSLIDVTLHFAHYADPGFLGDLGSILSLNAHTDPRAYAWLLARFEEQQSEAAIREWAEYLLLADAELAIPYLEDRLDQYSDQLQGILRGYIRNTRETGMP